MDLEGPEEKPRISRAVVAKMRKAIRTTLPKLKRRPGYVDDSLVHYLFILTTGIYGISQRKNKKTIETNVDALNLSKFDLEYDVDPLFKKNCAMFDEGRNGGVNFLTSLMIKVNMLL